MKRFKIDQILGGLLAMTMICMGALLFCGAGLINNSDQVFNGNITFQNQLRATGTKLDITGGIPRSQIAEDALVDYGYSIYGLRCTDGSVLPATESAACFYLYNESGLVMALGEVTDNETEVSDTFAQFKLPPSYVAGGDVSVSVRCILAKTGAAVNNGSTLDMICYKQADGATGLDICATAAQTFAAVDTYYTKTFVVTPTGLVAGDTLNLKFASSVIDSEAGGGTLQLKIDKISLLADSKG